ncbi:UNVERIFIED_CONTAM: hypothetical protein Sangu_2986300 [Sesamum angustifolium]|uniref:DUF4218 domain-containing protein n=1 Tax=Sesamum angustifolium TaxID=2727405 RepID=A0AAW2II79_9LAMI
MTLAEKDIFCKVLKSIRAPDGYASNISKCIQIEKRTIWGLKSYDNHVLMKNLLPITVRIALPKRVVDVLIELCTFFRKLCSKVDDKFELEKIQDRIALTLFHLERIFPPSCFDIMEHFPIHLVVEALIAGVIQYRWMYPIERFLMTLKKYMRNNAHPEGLITKGYVLEECMTFCSRYLSDVESSVYKLPRNNGGNHNTSRLIGNGKRFHLDHVTWVQAHRYVLENSDAVKSYRDLHMSQLRSDFPRTKRKEIERLHHERFHEWFKEYINNEEGLKVDDFKFTLVNFNHVMYTGEEYSDEPYILSTQAEQVWYVDEPLELDWKVVVRISRRDNFDIYSWERQVEIHVSLELDDRPILGDSNWGREEVEVLEVDDNDEEDIIQDECDI